MKHFGNISNLADVVTKQYVDDLMGGSHTPSATDTYSLGTQSLRYLAAHIKTLTVATLSSVNNNQILLSDAAPYNYYLGVNGEATKLASLTVTSLTANGPSAIADATDYSVSQGIASAALTVNGGAHIAKKLHVGSDTYLDGDTQLSGVLNITGVTGYAQGIRIHPSGGTSSIWFGAANNTGFDAGMWGITVDTVTGDTPSTKIRIRGTATADSTTPVDYLTIINGGYVGINVTPSSSYRLYVSGASRFNGTVNLGGTTYYLGNGAAASKLYSLTVGSATALSVSSAGVVSVANTTAFSGTASTGALKVSGGAYIAGNLGVYGKKIYFDATHYLEYDSTNNALHAYNMGFYADSFVNSGGLGVNGEGSGGSAITMLGSSSLGGSFGDSDLTQAFNAYTVNYINNRVTATNSALSSLRAGNIEFTSLLLQNTNNSPTLNFKGEYNNSQGANITLGALSGYKETISSVAYTGLKVSSDLFIPNGKHLYTYNYSGAPRSIAYYATANYDYLQLGDSAGVTNIKGSTVQINDSALGNAAFKGVATSISSSSTDANLATAKAVYTYVSNNCVTSSALNDYALTSSLGTAAYKGVATSISSSSTDDNLATAKAVYDGCLPKYSTSYSSSKITKSTTDKWWRIGSISTCYSSIELAFGNSYSANEPAYAYFNISQGYTNDGAKIGQPCYIITQTGGYSKFVKAIRLVYFKTSRGTGYTTAYIEVLIAANCTNTLYCQATSSRAAITWLTTPTAGVIGASSASTDYAAVTLYTSRGPSTSGGYNCTWLFSLAANASIVQTETTKANFIMEDFLNALSTGTPLMWVTESVTMNSVTYTMRYDVHVGKRGTAGLMLYYYNSPNSGSVEMTCIEIGYSSGWKVTAKYTKTL